MEDEPYAAGSVGLVCSQMEVTNDVMLKRGVHEFLNTKRLHGIKTNYKRHLWE